MRRLSPMEPTTTRPVFSPMRTARSAPPPSPAYDPRSRSLRRMLTAASTARRASSSWASGAPNSAMKPSPRNWLMVPSSLWTSASASSKNPLSRACMRSGPTRSASGVEFAMSQKSTVTCLRSPSRAPREVRMRSARCLGVYAAGEANSLRPRRSRPHSRQNFAESGSSVEQFGHRIVVARETVALLQEGPQHPGGLFMLLHEPGEEVRGAGVLVFIRHGVHVGAQRARQRFVVGQQVGQHVARGRHLADDVLAEAGQLLELLEAAGGPAAQRAGTLGHLVDGVVEGL